MKIVADSHIPFIQEYFSQHGQLVLKPGRELTRTDLRDADMLLVRSITRVDQQLLAETKIKFVGSITAGIDHLDTGYLERMGIVWSAALGFNAPPVANYVISVLAALQNMKQPKLHHPRPKAAIIGVGHVGQLVRENLLALNFDVVVCDPIRAQHEPGFASTPLEELADLDLITLHVPLTKTGRFATHHCINKAFLQRQKTGCVLLNTSRGSVINSEELLLYGNHLHWCFDVWEHEPHISKAILEKALIASPHIAGYSVQSKIRGIQTVYQIACKQGFIKQPSFPPIITPYHSLPACHNYKHWQDVVLAIFNPLALTETMREQLLASNERAALFDEMRNHFNYRHEFKYCLATATAELSAENQNYLRHLGLKLE